ncbi:mediator of RNA polymerase II transcription subunit 1-domain-containing protein [Podospora fimiseda]|uniref:Mediator of RNA polymerase II transcription subunit 1 n=1 Tax=Podospora fimiseda TaxID=252190 RepID=A0AAN7BUE2_9PEZI|nr:mediator of RNA polymerase II transcription subunit 1-domain-containing protein [Podospora fimiseda]
MATPTPMKHTLSQQGKTPSQSQHGAAATPPVSTPFSVAHAAFSPLGPRSSPQQVKKSPATSSTMAGHPSASAVNFDSPSASAALSAMQMGVGMDLGLSGLALARSTEDERAKRLDAIIGNIGQSQGLVSENGLERLAKRLGLDYFWDTGMSGPSTKKTLIVGGSALELVIEFNRDMVQTLTLGFPDSAEIVTKHAAEAGKILLEDLQLSENQSPLTKSLDRFATNFKRLAMLDKLSINPGLNLYEAVAGIFESLHRLYRWEYERVQEEPTLAAKGSSYIDSLVLCTRSGRPTMNARDRVGLSLDYWKEHRLQASGNQDAKIWGLLIDCAPMGEIGVGPVRVSTKWIGDDVVKVPLPGDLSGQLMIDWLDPEPTFLPGPSDPTKPDPMQSSSLLPGPRLPEAVFQATFDPPLHVSLFLWEQIRALGCGLSDSSAMASPVFYDCLVIPPESGKDTPRTEGRTVVCKKKVASVEPGREKLPTVYKNQINTLYIFDPAWGKTLTELTFSTPQHLISMQPYLRQYAFLSILLKNSFKQDDVLSPQQAPIPSNINGHPHPTKKNMRVLTNQDEYDGFMASKAAAAQEELDQLDSFKIDVTLVISPVPRLRVVFPFGENKTANVLLEIRENGYVHIESQNLLDETNLVATDGRQRRVEDIGELLSRFEDLGRWAEFLSSKWAVNSSRVQGMAEA